MSRDIPPSPVQPRLVSRPMFDMTRVERPLTFETSSFLGRPQLRRLGAFSAPAIESGFSTLCSKQTDRKPALIQLPRIDSTSSSQSGRSLKSPNPLSINNLLTSESLSGNDRRSLNQSSPPDPARPANDSRSTLSQQDLPIKDGHVSIEVDKTMTSCSPSLNNYEFEKNHPSWKQQPRPTLTHFQRCSMPLTPDEPQFTPTSNGPSRTSSYLNSSQSSPAMPGVRTFAPNLVPEISPQPPLNYALSMRQQPMAARACGFGERDRRVIDPPPIIELKITDKATGALESDPNAMLALHCTLIDADKEEDDIRADVASARRLMGTLVASPYQAKDENGLSGTFFVFSDLSCRIPGRYSLRFRLLRVDPMLMMPGVKHGSVACIEARVFTVYTAKDFPGMRASTPLLTALREQGLNVCLKRGTEARRCKRRKIRESGSDNEDGGFDHSDDESDSLESFEHKSL